MTSQNSMQQNSAQQTSAQQTSAQQNSTQQTSRQWDFGRFIKTLSYFGAIPFLSNVDWFQQWLGSRSNPKVDSQDSRAIAYASPALETDPSVAKNTGIAKGVVLVAGVTGSVGKQVVQRLLQQDHAVKALVFEAEPEPVAPAGLVEGLSVVKTDLTSLANHPNWMDHVTAVICCADASTLNEAAISALVQQVQESSVARQPVFNFAQPSTDLQEIWGALDDVVMGGVSQSSIRLGDGVAYFSGVVSTANSGGFASIRTRNLEPPLDLTAYEGVELRVKGDGKRYKFMLRTETRWDGVAYCYSFDTVADEWITVRIPFAALVPVFRARTIDNASLDLHRVCAWQLMLSKFEYDGALNPHFEPGFFQLQVASIQVYRQVNSAKFILISPNPEIPSQLNGIAVVIHPATLTDAPGGQPLRTDRQPLTGQVSAEDVAALAVAALEAPETQLRLFVAEGESECGVGDWACLLKAGADR